MKTVLESKVQVDTEIFTVKDVMYSADIKHNTKFIEDLDKSLRVNNSNSNMGTYNLIVSKRDIGLFCIGMKPHKNWRLKDLKEYFGLKGKKEKCKDQIELLVDLFLN